MTARVRGLRPLGLCAFCFALLINGCNGVPAEPVGDKPAPVPVRPDDDIDDASVVEPSSEPSLLVVPSYEVSGEMVHPDAFISPTGWHGTRYWFAATPYPSGNAAYENPSIFTSRSWHDWKPPRSLVNPIALPAHTGYLSDPDIVLDPVRDELRLYYRQTVRDVDQLFLKTSKDGAVWSAPVLVVESPRYDLISPAVVRESDGWWRMWTVSAQNGGCGASAKHVSLTVRRSRDGIAWKQPEHVALSIPGRVPWHWDVQYVTAKSEYWALVAAYPDGQNCSATSVFFAQSPDGVTWSVAPNPLLRPGESTPLRDIVYRSTFRYFPKRDRVIVWFSGARFVESNYHFALASASYSLSNFLARVRRPAPTMAVAPDSDRVNSPTPAQRAAREAFVKHFP